MHKAQETKLVNYFESAFEPKDHHSISTFKVDDSITDYVREVRDNSLSDSLTTCICIQTYHT